MTILASVGRRRRYRRGGSGSPLGTAVYVVAILLGHRVPRFGRFARL
jgi:hypothetical protein